MVCNFVLKRETTAQNITDGLSFLNYAGVKISSTLIFQDSLIVVLDYGQDSKLEMAHQIVRGERSLESTIRWYEGE